MRGCTVCTQYGRGRVLKVDPAYGVLVNVGEQTRWFAWWEVEV
jgi:hypothetical protein